MKIIKMIIFTLVYPLWFFLAKTWLGGVLMIGLIPLTMLFIIWLIFPDLMNDVSQEEAKGIGGGMAIFSILCSPIFIIPLVIIGRYLERHYEEWNYITEMNIEMF
jgi:hypothetical protein